MKLARLWASWPRPKAEKCREFSRNASSSPGGFDAVQSWRSLQLELSHVRVSGGADGTVLNCHEVVHDALHALVQ